MESSIHRYLSELGRRGGKKSRRCLDPQTARDMVRLREVRRAFRRYRNSCFWSCDPGFRVGLSDLEWVAEQLMKHGDRKAWELGAKLCR